jgi:hypothetical protein
MKRATLCSTVRILLDECLPRRLKRAFAGHHVRTVPEAGWASRKNGDLLAVAQEQFDVLLTVDRNLSVEQDVSRYRIAVVVMSAPSNRLADLEPLAPAVLAVLDAARPGTILRVAR